MNLPFIINHKLNTYVNFIAWTNVKISRQLEERAYADKIRLERASRPAIEKNAQESVADSTTHSTNSFSNKR